MTVCFLHRMYVILKCSHTVYHIHRRLFFSWIELGIISVYILFAYQISSCEVYKIHTKHIGLVTFGMPRTLSNDEHTLSKAGAGIRDGNGVNYTHFRVVNHGDPVPSVPPGALGFTHNATEVFFYHPSDEVCSYVCCRSCRGCNILVMQYLEVAQTDG